MLYIVIKLDMAVDGTWTLGEEIKVSEDLEAAVWRIGGWPGELFGAWHWWDDNKEPTRAEAESLIRNSVPGRVWVLSRRGILLPLHEIAAEDVLTRR